MRTGDGEVYWWNPTTNETSWETPDAAVTAQQRPQQQPQQQQQQQPHAQQAHVGKQGAAEADYIPAFSWCGTRDGYVFTTRVTSGVPYAICMHAVHSDLVR